MFHVEISIHNPDYPGSLAIIVMPEEPKAYDHAKMLKQRAFEKWIRAMTRDELLYWWEMVLADEFLPEYVFDLLGEKCNEHQDCHEATRVRRCSSSEVDQLHNLTHEQLVHVSIRPGYDNVFIDYFVLDSFASHFIVKYEDLEPLV